jgi:hypothetical protein
MAANNRNEKLQEKNPQEKNPQEKNQERAPQEKPQDFLIQLTPRLCVKPEAISAVYISLHETELPVLYTLYVCVDGKNIEIQSDMEEKILLDKMAELNTKINSFLAKRNSSIMDIVNSLYYAPGMPGYVNAQESFFNLASRGTI